MEPRDYGPFPYTPINARPKLEWPDGARVAVWVIPNIEFFPLTRGIAGHPEQLQATHPRCAPGRSATTATGSGSGG
jgi:hypothetical protein